MNNVINICGTDITVKEWNGKRVVTFKEIDAMHQRPDGTARKRFSDNRIRFINGVDFFKITPSEYRTAIGNMDSRQQNSITLITETGYLMLVKSFTDDLAWEVQRELVDSYFRVRVDSEDDLRDAVSSGVPTLVISTDNVIRCAEIMARCLEGNRGYVLNILRSIIPNIDTGVKEEDTTLELPVLEDGKDYSKPFNYVQFNNYLIENRIKHHWLQNELGCSQGLVSKWACGKNKPTEAYRVKLCRVLNLPIGYFDNSRRVRRVSQYE